jgi:hypothetical protein
MNSFDYMTLALTPPAEIVLPANPNKIEITKGEFDIFYKEFVFEKLKGNSLALAFADTFYITDVIFRVNISDDFALDYIKTHYLMK